MNKAKKATRAIMETVMTTLSKGSSVSDFWSNTGAPEGPANVV